jgi:putative cross-wall-targeting lipoprotein signal
MKNRFDEKVKGHGFFRKTKAFGLASGVALGAALLVGANTVSADEVKSGEGSTPTTAVAAETKAPVVTDTAGTSTVANATAKNQGTTAETKEASKTEVKDQAGLDKKYSELKEQAKKLDVEVKEGKKVTHDTVENASKDLGEQNKKIEELAKSRDEANAKLQKAIADAKAVGINVQLDKKVTYDVLAKGEEDVAKQVKELNALTEKIKDAQGRLSKAVETAKQAGVKFEGVKTIDLKDGDVETFSKQVEEAEKTLNEVVAQQKAVEAELNKVVAEAKVKGVNVSIEGETVVEPKDAQKVIAEAKAKVAKAIADAEAKNKTIRENNAKVNEANKNAKAELVSGSTATKNADGSYTQFVSVKNEKAGSKWNGSVVNSGSADIVSAKLVSPSGKETVFANGKVDSSKTLDEVGEYKLVYTFKAKDNTAGSVSGKLSVEGQTGQNGKAAGSVAFATKSTEQVSSEFKPREILVPVDGSGSTSGGTSEPVLQDLTTIANSMNDKDRVMLAFYETNNVGSYYTMGAEDKDRPVSRLMSKQELLGVLEKVKPNKNNNFMASSWYQELFKGNLMYDFQGKKGSQEIEELFDKVRNKDVTAVVIQLTDDWKMPDEQIDGSIVDWATKNAKTFMSVIYGDAESRANKSMVAAGHPNIYLAKPNGSLIPNEERSKKISEQIAATTIEKVTKGEAQTVKITVGGNGVTVSKATLKGATTKELTVKDGKVEFSEKLTDGNYTLEFEATGNGTATAVVNIDGKEVSKKVVEVKSTAGTNGATSVKEDKLQSTKLSNSIKEVEPAAVKLTKVSLKVAEPKAGEAVTKAHEIGVSSEVHPVDVAKKAVIKETSRKLPHTGTEVSAALVVAGMGALALAGVALKKKER